MRDNNADFTRFVVANQAGLLRAALLLTGGNRAAAEDLVQDTLIKLYVKWSAVEAMDGALYYARRTLTNTFITHTRKAWVRRERSTDAEILLPEKQGPDPTTREVVLRALAHLPPRQRAAVVLRYWLDLDVETTARMLGCSPGTVKSQTWKALKSLRIALTEVSSDLFARSES